MTVLGIVRDRLIQPANNGVTTLRDGQIVQGKILKIFPNNRAEIQIGAHKLVAEITTPLSVGRGYFFQVQAADKLVQLKVIGEPLKQENSQNIVHLLTQLGIKGTKLNSQFMHALMNDKVSFTEEQLQQAVQMLEKAPSKTDAMQVLKEMIANHLPMTNTIFQALSSNQHTTISPLLHQLITELKQLPHLQDSQQKLLTLLESIVERPLSSELQLVKQMFDAPQQRETIFTLLKMAGIVDINQQVSRLNNAVGQFLQANRNHISVEQFWNSFIGREIYKESSMSQTVEQPINSLKTNFQHTTGQNIGEKEVGQFSSERSNQILQTLSTIVVNAREIQAIAAKIIGLFHHPLKTNTISSEQLATWRNMIMDELIPLLPTITKEKIRPLFQQIKMENNTQLIQLLQMMANKETYKIAQDVLLTETKEHNSLYEPLQRQFITHINNYVHSIGLLDESQLKMHFSSILEQGETIVNHKQPETVKSLLLQMIQQENVGSNERVHQLLHFINGMQLQSVQESNNFLHAALQIPGEKLGLHKDIFMQFEGKKTEKDQIDPDYCRILFVLHLHHLQETIIDMHIQKRIISVTIFNDIHDLTYNNTDLKETLAHNLNKLHYHLSTITWKPLHVPEQNETTKQPKKDLNNQKERFDFFI
ncbi:hypothetical protein [Pseudogracilibacillus auburnensis]|uniref:hypothetical protein n=1 Tax=Pseudogracilibacillus auburnensis TaxID=1494959 RepID=UPI001A97C216|nr:hypothetical protein [Pseudogracilibacillus auburnensis]MBO1003822.1 hypothetical protein [Pseudogracilibacillus auburnensis]